MDEDDDRATSASSTSTANERSSASANRRRPGRPRAFDPDDALERAMLAFWARGYEALGTEDLLGAMGIGRQSAYNAFGGKLDLFLAALRRYGETRIAGLTGPLEAPGAGLAEVRQVLGWWGLAGAAPPRTGCLLVNSLAEFGSGEPRVAGETGAQLGRVRAAFRRGLEGAVAAGEVPGDLPLDAAAALLTSVGAGLNLMGKTGTPEADLQAAADLAVQQLQDRGAR